MGRTFTTAVVAALAPPHTLKASLTFAETSSTQGKTSTEYQGKAALALTLHGLTGSPNAVTKIDTVLSKIAAARGVDNVEFRRMTSLRGYQDTILSGMCSDFALSRIDNTLYLAAVDPAIRQTTPLPWLAGIDTVIVFLPASNEVYDGVPSKTTIRTADEIDEEVSLDDQHLRLQNALLSALDCAAQQSGTTLKKLLQKRIICVPVPPNELDTHCVAPHLELVNALLDHPQVKVDHVLSPSAGLKMLKSKDQICLALFITWDLLGVKSSEIPSASMHKSSVIGMGWPRHIGGGKSKDRKIRKSLPHRATDEVDFREAGSFKASKDMITVDKMKWNRTMALSIEKEYEVPFGELRDLYPAEPIDTASVAAINAASSAEIATHKGRMDDLNESNRQQKAKDKANAKTSSKNVKSGGKRAAEESSDSDGEQNAKTSSKNHKNGGKARGHAGSGNSAVKKRKIEEEDLSDFVVSDSGSEYTSQSSNADRDGFKMSDDDSSVKPSANTRYSKVKIDKKTSDNGNSNSSFPPSTSGLLSGFNNEWLFGDD